MFASISSCLSRPTFLAAIVCFSALLVSPELTQAQFTQQGPKLAGQGASVALSGNGNTAIVGGGGAAVYTRSDGVWTQQGAKLVGTGAVGDANQGYSVALSADGNTAIVGGPFDNSGAGAAWVYTGVWTQQGAKLVGSDVVGLANQGYSVTLRARATEYSLLRRRSGVGLHPQQRCLDPAGCQAGRQRCSWISQSRLVRRAVWRR
jgi:hypothetical protein